MLPLLKYIICIVQILCKIMYIIHWINVKRKRMFLPCIVIFLKDWHYLLHYYTFILIHIITITTVLVSIYSYVVCNQLQSVKYIHLYLHFSEESCQYCDFRAAETGFKWKSWQFLFYRGIHEFLNSSTFVKNNVSFNSML